MTKAEKARSDHMLSSRATSPAVVSAAPSTSTSISTPSAVMEAAFPTYSQPLLPPQSSLRDSPLHSTPSSLLGSAPPSNSGPPSPSAASPSALFWDSATYGSLPTDFRASAFPESAESPSAWNVGSASHTSPFDDFFQGTVFPEGSSLSLAPPLSVCSFVGRQTPSTSNRGRTSSSD